MSEVFEGYEREYCELSSNLTRKCSSLSLLNGEQKKQKLSDIKIGLEEAESLIRKMDLEARTVQPNAKAMVLAKLREYKNDLSNLKAEVKRLSNTADTLAARDALLESGMADALMASADQRGRLLMSTERLNQSTDRVRQSRMTMQETEAIGVSILEDLHQQRQSLLHAHNTFRKELEGAMHCLESLDYDTAPEENIGKLHGVDENIGRSKKILTGMSKRMNRNKCIIGSIIAVLILTVILILYFKLRH